MTAFCTAGVRYQLFNDISQSKNLTELTSVSYAECKVLWLEQLCLADRIVVLDIFVPDLKHHLGVTARISPPISVKSSPPSPLWFFCAMSWEGGRITPEIESMSYRRAC